MFLNNIAASFNAFHYWHDRVSLLTKINKTHDTLLTFNRPDCFFMRDFRFSMKSMYVKMLINYSYLNEEFKFQLIEIKQWCFEINNGCKFSCNLYSQ